MPNFNKVILMGNLTRDPELRTTTSGTSVCNLSMAINRKYKETEETTYVRLVAWQKQAETIATYFSKGDPIHIEGRLQYREWTTDDGSKRNTLEVVVERFEFVKARNDKTAAPPVKDDCPF